MEENLNDTWNHPSCWSCNHIYLELGDGYHCKLTGKKIGKVEANSATDCKNWNR